MSGLKLKIICCFHLSNFLSPLEAHIHKQKNSKVSESNFCLFVFVLIFIILIESEVNALGFVLGFNFNQH